MLPCKEVVSSTSLLQIGTNCSPPNIPCISQLLGLTETTSEDHSAIFTDGPKTPRGAAVGVFSTHLLLHEKWAMEDISIIETELAAITMAAE